MPSPRASEEGHGVDGRRVSPLRDGEQRLEVGERLPRLGRAEPPREVNAHVVAVAQLGQPGAAADGGSEAASDTGATGGEATDDEGADSGGGAAADGGGAAPMEIDGAQQAADASDTDDRPAGAADVGGAAPAQATESDASYYTEDLPIAAYQPRPGPASCRLAHSSAARPRRLGLMGVDHLVLGASPLRWPRRPASKSAPLWEETTR